MLIDLDHVLALGSRRSLPVGVMGDWLRTAESHLDDARSIDVIRLQGSARVADALRAEAGGLYV